MAIKAKHKPSQATTMHHLAWGIVCFILLLCMGGLWVHAQSLDNKVHGLESKLAATKQSAQTTCRVNGEWQPGTTKVQTINGRQFGVHTPKNFTSHDYYPLIMLYPGKGASAESAQIAYGTDSFPAIVVYPHPTISTDGAFAWQGAPYSSKANDVQFTAAILDKVQSDLCIDRTKVYAVGMSNGGGFASLLSCKLSDRFAAYAIVSGALYAPAGDCKPPRPTPLINVHGDNDTIVPYTGSFTRHLPNMDAWVAQRATYNGCKTPTTLNNVYSVVTTWHQCNSNATVQNVRIVGGGHGWGGLTNDELWQFLSQYSL